MIKRGKEDYLRVIFELDYDKHNPGVKVIEIAEKLEITKASVSEMIKKLSAQGLVKSAPYGKIFLTAKGKKHAESHYDKHDTIRRFFKKIFNYEENKAYAEAHELEHAFSQETIEILKQFVEGRKEIKIIPTYIR